MFDAGDLIIVLFLVIANGFLLNFSRFLPKKYKISRNIVLAIVNSSFLFFVFFPHFFPAFGWWRYYYIVIMSVFSLLMYIAMMAVIYRFIVLIFRFKSRSKSTKILKRICLATGIIIFFIGFYQAYVPQVRTAQVDINNLPSFWEDKKIAILADQHLGYIFNTKILKDNVETINSLDPDLVIIPGDLFNGDYENIEKFKPILNKLQAEDGVYFTTGNHDYELRDSKVINFIESSDVNLLQNEAIRKNSLELIGLNFTKEEHEVEDIENLDPREQDNFRILINHAPADRDLAKAIGTDLQISGHTHRGQFFPLSLVTHLSYGPYYHGLTTEGDYNIYTSGGAGCWALPIRTFNQAEINLLTLK